MGLRELIKYVKIIKRRWIPIVVLFLTTMVTLIVISYFSPRVFVASARFQVIAPSPGTVTLYGGYRGGAFRDEIAYTQNTFIEILKSRGVARRTVEAVDTQLSVDELQTRTEVIVESDFVNFQVAGDESEEAALLANTLFDKALVYYGELLARSSEASGEFIANQLEQARQELDQTQTALMQFKIENKLGSLEGDISQQTNLIRSLRLARDEAMANNDITKANAYDVLIEQREQELQNLLNLSARYQTLQTAVEQATTNHDFLLGKETEAKIAENQTRNVNFIQVLEPADPPSKSISSFSNSIFILGAVLSLVLGIAVAFIWEYIATTPSWHEETPHDLSAHQANIG